MKNITHFFIKKEVIIPIITIIISIILIKILSKLVKKVLMKDKDKNSIIIKKRNTIVTLLVNIITYIILLIGILIILSNWGIDVSGIITSLGVVGIIAGLALQDALKDIIAGCNIILDNYFIVGDIIEINGFTGEVIQFGLKTTKIRSISNGNVMTISNREITKVINISEKDAKIFITIPAPYEEKLERVEKVIKKICDKIDEKEKLQNHTKYLGINKLADSSVEYYIQVESSGEKQYQIKRDIYVIIKETFEEEGLSIPYNQIEVHEHDRK